MLSRKFSLVPRVWGAGAACDYGAGVENKLRECGAYWLGCNA